MTKISYQSVPGTPGGVAIAKYGNYLYTAGDTLCVYDVSPPGIPKLLKKMHGFGAGRQMEISNGKLYLTARHYGLWILSLKNPASPKRIGRYDTVELATGLAVNGDMVFVSERIFGIEIIDCSDPRHPQHCSMIRTDEAQSVTFHNGLLYAGEWCASKLSVIDVSDPYHPVIRCQKPLGGYGDGVVISRNICCAATGLNKAKNANAQKALGDGHGLDIFRLSAKGIPERIARVEYPIFPAKACDFWSVRICRNTAFSGDTFNGVFLVDLATPEKPVIIGHFDLPETVVVDTNRTARRPDAVGNLAIGKGILYVVGVHTGLHYAELREADESKIEHEKIFSFQKGRRVQDTLPNFHSVNLGGQVRRISADEKDSRIFAACSHAGIKILNEQREIIGERPVRCSYDVVYRDGKLYSAEGTDGFAVYAVEGNELRETARFKSKAMIQLINISANQHFAVCGNRSGDLAFLDIHDEKKICKVRQYCHGGLLYGDTLPEKDHTNLIPVLWPYHGSAWYDLSREKMQIAYEDWDCVSGQSDGITWFKGKYIQTTTWKKLRFLDPESFGKKYEEVDLGFSGVPSACGDIVAFSHRRSGFVHVCRISGKTITPLLERSFENFSGFPDRVVFFKGKMLIPCGWQGMLMEK